MPEFMYSFASTTPMATGIKRLYTEDKTYASRSHYDHVSCDGFLQFMFTLLFVFMPGQPNYYPSHLPRTVLCQSHRI